ncbi:uncharacterized protein LOC133795724 [Humulus lupulus]|uniref:uncharacterized protein LOC133795724 n=1 Tax=Humulus lupulus TaxID=3486 RepID=UPI002B406B12|nr:uncharacterized protein LOC133795724 [Humulus lupulus]
MRFYITFVCGYNDEVGIGSLWQEIVDSASNIDEAWMILGDFNEILYSKERVGNKTNKKPSERFRYCLLHCQMEDLKYSGCFYTWNNKQQAEDRVCSKIDRAVVNPKWADAFPNSKVVFLPKGAFDHCPILVSFYQDTCKGHKPFWYYKMWRDAKNFGVLVKSSWEEALSGTPMYKVVKKLKRLKGVLLDINRKGFNDIQVAELQAKQIMLESQKAKTNWVQFGDENTAFFHTSLKTRMAHNIINSIKNGRGLWVDNSEDVKDAFLDYYQELLGTTMTNMLNVIKAIVEMAPLLSAHHIGILQTEFTQQEVKGIFYAIPGMKVSGPDGYGSFFFRITGIKLARKFVISLKRIKYYCYPHFLPWVRDGGPGPLTG